MGKTIQEEESGLKKAGNSTLSENTAPRREMGHGVVARQSERVTKRLEYIPDIRHYLADLGWGGYARSQEKNEEKNQIRVNRAFIFFLARFWSQKKHLRDVFE